MPKTCAFKRSDMTPCVITDGPVCYAANSADRPICVGCERPPSATGVAPEPDFAEALAAYKARNAR